VAKTIAAGFADPKMVSQVVVLAALLRGLLLEPVDVVVWHSV
jgi:hypothetical protein